MRLTGILVRRKEDTGPFRVYFEIKAEADLKFSWANGWKNLWGTEHKTDPVKLVPGKNYLGWEDVAGISKEQPSVAMVRKYGDAKSWVQLEPVRAYERRDGEWQEVEGQKDAAKE